jgi:Ca-activated chloride channel homolog
MTFTASLGTLRKINMVLAHPFWLLLLLLLPLPWIWLRRRGYTGFSAIRLANAVPGNTFLYRLPLALMSLGFIALIIALAQPQRVQIESTQSMKARDIIIAVDISGSMGGAFQGEIPQRAKNPELDRDLPPRPPKPVKPGEPPHTQRRVDAAQAAVIRFVEDRYLAHAGDRVGIMVFDFSPHWSWPLTHDLKMIYRKGEFVDEGLGGGTNFGEQKPGPVDAAAEHFDELGQSVTKVFIMVTDGEDNLSSSTVSRLADLMESRGVHFYLIGVGETLAQRDVDIIQLTQRVNGRVFRVENAKDMADCFASINEMERSVVQTDTTKKYDELFFYFAAAAVLLFLLGAAAEALIVSQ